MNTQTQTHTHIPKTHTNKQALLTLTHYCNTTHTHPNQHRTTRTDIYTKLWRQWASLAIRVLQTSPLHLTALFLV